MAPLAPRFLRHWDITKEKRKWLSLPEKMTILKLSGLKPVSDHFLCPSDFDLQPQCVPRRTQASAFWPAIVTHLSIFINFVYCIRCWHKDLTDGGGGSNPKPQQGDGLLKGCRSPVGLLLKKKTWKLRALSKANFNIWIFSKENWKTCFHWRMCLLLWQNRVNSRGDWPPSDTAYVIAPIKALRRNWKISPLWALLPPFGTPD